MSMSSSESDPEKGELLERENHKVQGNFYNLSWGLILGRGFVLVPSSFAVKSLGLGVRELEIQSLGFGVRELKTLFQVILKLGGFVRNYLRYFLGIAKLILGFSQCRV